jgi:hypothetical protein
MSQNDVIEKSTSAGHSVYVVDERTGEVHKCKKEDRVDHAFAIASVVYLLLTMAFFFWLLFDTWIGQNSLPKVLGYRTQPLSDPAFLSAAYASIGGALGGIVNGIRSFLVWHSERFAFGRRFIWKYIAAPWLGVCLALFTLALIRSGLAVFGGDVLLEPASVSQMIATFAIGVLAGYGSRDVFIWLDAQVKRAFQVQRMPTLIGKTRQEAKDILLAARLTLGPVIEKDIEDPALVGKVIRQVPPPNSPVSRSESVSITIGRLSISDNSQR